MKRGFDSMRNLPVILITACWMLAGTGYAQLRPLPANAKRATVSQQQYPLPYINLGDKVIKLAPGGVIYDQNNRSLVHGSLPPGADVVFTTDMNGDVARIYILTPQEQAQLNQQK